MREVDLLWHSSIWRWSACTSCLCVRTSASNSCNNASFSRLTRSKCSRKCYSACYVSRSFEMSFLSREVRMDWGNELTLFYQFCSFLCHYTYDDDDIRARRYFDPDGAFIAGGEFDSTASFDKYFIGFWFYYSFLASYSLSLALLLYSFDVGVSSIGLLSEVSGCNFRSCRCCYSAIISAMSFTSSSFNYGSWPAALLDNVEVDDDDDDVKDALRSLCVAF